MARDGQAIIKPSDVLKFAQQLKQYNRMLQDQSRTIRGRLSSLGGTWRDQEYEKFEHEFSRAMLAIDKFLQQSEQYVNHLNKKAEKAQDYLDS